MVKIKLLQPLWNREAGAIMNVNKEAAEFALRKKYAELYIEPIEPKKAETTDYKNKIEPEAKKLRNKFK